MDTLQKAKNYCLLLLKYRLRSQKELYNRLKNKKFDEAVIQEALRFMKTQGFVDDATFAKEWIAWRIKKPLGVRRLEQELREKGIDPQVIAEHIDKIKEGYSEEEVVSKIARARMEKLKGIGYDKARARVYGYLLRRGFTPEIVINVINRLEQ
jgi:regulatory protein